MVIASMRSISAARLRTRSVSLAKSGSAVHSGWPSTVAQALEQPIGGGAERDVAVGAADRLIRREHAMRRSERLGRDAPAKYSAASQTESAMPASTSDVSMYCPRPVRWR